MPTPSPHHTPTVAEAPIDTDALVVGAGPVGLFQAFQLGLQEIRCHVVDALDEPGGQCAELYPDKPIYDVPGIPVCSGRELAERLMRQLAPLRPVFHFGQEVCTVAARGDGRFDVGTSAGRHFVAKTVFVAGGVGAFQPRALKVRGLDAHAGTQLHYRVRDARSLAGRRVVIAGDGDEAVGWALRLADPGDPDLAADGSTPRAAQVTLVHRRDDFRAAPADVARLHALCDAGVMRFVPGQPTGFDETPDGRLAALRVAAGDDGHEETLPLDVLLVFLGLSPRLGPIADWGLGIERRQVTVDTASFETTTPGIYAVGDINTYPGKRKLIVCGFHEATLAAFAAAAVVHPERPVQLQYTTTSPRLHHLLGVSVPDDDRRPGGPTR